MLQQNQFLHTSPIRMKKVKQRNIDGGSKEQNIDEDGFKIPTLFKQGIVRSADVIRSTDVHVVQSADDPVVIVKGGTLILFCFVLYITLGILVL